jgi:predicted homoserine dehydrogenase-like protein
VTDDPFLLCRAEQIDVLVDLTGSVEFGAQVMLEAARNGKHVVLMNAELDATIGPILNVYAQRAGVIMSACDGDEPGLQMNLVVGSGDSGSRRASSATSKASRIPTVTPRPNAASRRSGARTRRW